MLSEDNNNKLSFYRERLEQLYRQIKSSAESAGRDPSAILLIAASKYASPGQVKEMAGLGVKDFGENRAEDLLKKYQEIGENVRWHFIGQLQGRKVKTVVGLVHYIHSVDSIKLLEKINSEALKIPKIQKVLIEVNVSGEQAKYGIKPFQVRDFLSEAKSFKNVSICGLMTMAPLTDDKLILKNTFAGLKKMLDEIKKIPGFSGVKELSMGMSNDFAIAIAEGATMLRIGSLIFK